MHSVIDGAEELGPVETNSEQELIGHPDKNSTVTVTTELRIPPPLELGNPGPDQPSTDSEAGSAPKVSHVFMYSKHPDLWIKSPPVARRSRFTASQESLETIKAGASLELPEAESLVATVSIPSEEEHGAAMNVEKPGAPPPSSTSNDSLDNIPL